MEEKLYRVELTLGFTVSASNNEDAVQKAEEELRKFQDSCSREDIVDYVEWTNVDNLS